MYHGVVVPRARLNFYFFPTYTAAEGFVFENPNYEAMWRYALAPFLPLCLHLSMACEWAGRGMSGIRIYLLFFKLWSLGPRMRSGSRVVARGETRGAILESKARIGNHFSLEADQPIIDQRFLNHTNTLANCHHHVIIDIEHFLQRIVDLNTCSPFPQPIRYQLLGRLPKKNG